MTLAAEFRVSPGRGLTMEERPGLLEGAFHSPGITGRVIRLWPLIARGRPILPAWPGTVPPQVWSWMGVSFSQSQVTEAIPSMFSGESLPRGQALHTIL